MRPPGGNTCSRLGKALVVVVPLLMSCGLAGRAPVCLNGSDLNCPASADESSRSSPSPTGWELGFCVFELSELPKSAPNVLFPTATLLADGKVLIAGGFTAEKEEDGTVVIGLPTSLAWIFDPTSGIVRQAKDQMNAPRGAHAGVYLPNTGRVLLVGGADRLYRATTDSCFPWYFNKETAGYAGYTYELFDPVTESFLKWDSLEWPDYLPDQNEPSKMNPTHTMTRKVPRVFPTASPNRDGTVIVAGGGSWPSCATSVEMQPDYQVAEFYRDKASSTGESGFTADAGDLTMRTSRAGHAAASLSSKDYLATHLFVGGSLSSPTGEFYTEPDGRRDWEWGTFADAWWASDFDCGERLFFPCLSSLGDEQFLLSGGVRHESGTTNAPSASGLFLIKAQLGLTLSASETDGLGAGRYFHTAVTSPDRQEVLIVGGFEIEQGDGKAAFSDFALADVTLFELQSNTAREVPVEPPLPPVAGAAATVLPSGWIVLAGGAERVGHCSECRPREPSPLQVRLLVPQSDCLSTSMDD